MAINSMLSRKRDAAQPSRSSSQSSATLENTEQLPTASHAEKGTGLNDESKVPFLTIRTFIMAILVSMGGLCFGYDTGQISGFLEMDNFLDNFADVENPRGFSDIRSGLIVGLLSIGTLIGALIAGPIADTKTIGRKYSICIWSIVFCIGNVIQIASMYPHWYQLVIGRVVSGLSIGGLSVMVPAYQGESAPTHVRGAIVCSYQLFITIGILLANLINFGTESIENTGSWRIPMGVGFLFPLVLGVGILFFPETPRHEYRHGKIDSAVASISKFYGVPENHVVVKKQLDEMHNKLQVEMEGGKPKFGEIFTGKRMLYRVMLGMVIQALQQMTGTNFFLYYGVGLFSSVGLSNSFVTQIIIASVNVVCTFPGLYFVEKFGRRKCLTIGAAWMFICFMIFASLGQFALTDENGNNSSTIGTVMIVFTCLFIAAFASTWGPMAWAVTSEIFPGRYRSQGIALCAASNWTFNFFIAFCTPFIVEQINFAYGYVFAGCNLFAVFFIFFCLPETSGRSLEVIDTMFLMEVKPWKSSSWEPPSADEMLATDRERTGSTASAAAADAARRKSQVTQQENINSA